MKTKEKTIIGKQARLITWVCALIYFTSYVLRLNFTVMLVKICGDLNVEKSAIAIVITCLTISYGFGQIISGILGDRFKPQLLITIGVIVAIVCNVLMFFSSSIPVMAVVWTINGFAQALLWPPILKLFSMYLNDAEYGYGVVRVSWGSSIATVFLYLVCPLCLSFLTWRQIILCCAVFGLIVFIIWILFNKKIFVGEIKENTEPDKIKPENKTKVKFPASIYISIALIMFGIICQGILRDGVTNWMPSFLLESFNIPEEKAIIATVILAIFSVFSYGIFNWIKRLFFKNELNCASFIFIISSIASLVLYIINKTVSSVIVSMLLMSVIVACMHGINLMLISIVPKHFAKSGKVSTYSGILNACTYIGSSISTYGFAVLAEIYGWNFTIFTWIIISVLGILVCKAAVWFGWTKKYNDYLS